jgi:hypothetical protein
MVRIHILECPRFVNLRATDFKFVSHSICPNRISPVRRTELTNIKNVQLTNLIKFVS